MSKKGFTLLELLVVIAIIGILSTATVVNLNLAKAKARDARRLSDIVQIQRALELYNYTHDGYPNPDCHNLPAIVSCTSLTAIPLTAWIPELTSELAYPLPIDPLNDVDELGQVQHAYVYTRSYSAVESDEYPYKGYYFLLYKLETQPLEDRCNGLSYPGWSCLGGGRMPEAS